MARITDIVKRRVATQKDCNGRWSGLPRGDGFRCYLCGHRFKVGDGWRMQFVPNVRNALVCDDCDGPDVVERWKAQLIEAKTRFWWYGAT